MYCLTIPSFNAITMPFTLPNEKCRIWTKKSKNEDYFRKHRKLLMAPCYEDENGVKEWYRDGIQFQVIKTEYSIETRAFITDDDYRLHSFSDHPAVIYSNGTKEWYCVGNLHRYTLPAIEYPNGDVEYWEWGKKNKIVIGNKQYLFENGEFQKCIV